MKSQKFVLYNNGLSYWIYLDGIEKFYEITEQEYDNILNTLQSLKLKNQPNTLIKFLKCQKSNLINFNKQIIKHVDLNNKYSLDTHILKTIIPKDFECVLDELKEDISFYLNIVERIIRDYTRLKLRQLYSTEYIANNFSKGKFKIKNSQGEIEILDIVKQNLNGIKLDVANNILNIFNVLNVLLVPLFLLNDRKPRERIIPLYCNKYIKQFNNLRDKLTFINSKIKDSEKLSLYDEYLLNRLNILLGNFSWKNKERELLEEIKTKRAPSGFKELKKFILDPKNFSTFITKL